MTKILQRVSKFIFAIKLISFSSVLTFSLILRCNCSQFKHFFNFGIFMLMRNFCSPLKCWRLSTTEETVPIRWHEGNGSILCAESCTIQCWKFKIFVMTPKSFKHEDFKVQRLAFLMLQFCSPQRALLISMLFVCFCAHFLPQCARLLWEAGSWGRGGPRVTKGRKLG